MSRPSSRRRFIASTLALTAAPAVIAQERWPNRPIRMIVPYPAGGNSDMVARWAADRLAAALGQPVIIENRAGAGATIGAQVAARAEPDG